MSPNELSADEAGIKTPEQETGGHEANPRESFHDRILDLIAQRGGIDLMAETAHIGRLVARAAAGDEVVVGSFAWPTSYLEFEWERRDRLAAVERRKSELVALAKTLGVTLVFGEPGQ